MPVQPAARIVGEHDARRWRVIHHYVDAGRARADYSGVAKLGLDETQAMRGHDCVTLFVDLILRRVLFVTPGKDAATVEAFVNDRQAHGGTQLPRHRLPGPGRSNACHRNSRGRRLGRVRHGRFQLSAFPSRPTQQFGLTCPRLSTLPRVDGRGPFFVSA